MIEIKIHWKKIPPKEREGHAKVDERKLTNKFNKRKLAKERLQKKVEKQC